MVKQIFETYDADQSNSMSSQEVKDMLLELDLDSTLGVSKDDVTAFIDAEFGKVRRRRSPRVRADTNRVDLALRSTPAPPAPAGKPTRPRH